MGGGVRLPLFLFLPICFAQAAGAGVVVNELYYDHPGADAGYEFVELLNTGASPVSLDGISLEFHNGSGVGWVVVWRAPNGLVLAPDALLVIGGSAVTPAPDVVFELALQNGPDAIRLVAAEGGVLDVVGYGGLDDPAYVETLGVAAIDAGQSIARTPDGRDSGDNASDFVAAAPTPGRRNVARHDVAPLLASDTPARAGRDRAGVERVSIEIENRGLVDIPASAVVVSVRDSSVDGTNDVASVRNASSIAPGANERVALEVTLSAPGYHWITVETRYGADERMANDRVFLVRRVGRPFLLVSEIMTAPRSGCPQFVELYNAGDDPIDITGYSFRDTRSQAASIDVDSLVIEPRGFIVVAADAPQLVACARDVVRVLDVMGSWPSFNRSGGTFADSVIVIDALGIPVDGVAYPGVPSGLTGRSLERVDLFPPLARRDAVWRLSHEVGGSPGKASDSSLEEPPAVSCEVSPNPFFPGRGDLLRIAVASVSGVASVVVRVYDPSGRKVSEVGSASAFPAVLLWDGRASDGDPVRSGIYVLTCESFSMDGSRVGVEKVVVGCASRSP